LIYKKASLQEAFLLQVTFGRKACTAPSSRHKRAPGWRFSRGLFYILRPLDANFAYGHKKTWPDNPARFLKTGLIYLTSTIWRAI